jgi:hypothetical protein
MRLKPRITLAWFRGRFDGLKPLSKVEGATEINYGI